LEAVVTPVTSKNKRYKPGDKFFIKCTTGDYKIIRFDEPQPAIVIKEITFEEYISLHREDQILPCMTKENALKNNRSFYLASTD